MKGKDHKEQENRNTTEVNISPEVQTQGVAQADMEELTQEELEQVSGGASRKTRETIWLMDGT